MYLISYDITKDSLRSRIGDKLIAVGLYRIQYSVYLGTLRQQDYRELLKWIQEAMKKANLTKDSIIIISLQRPQIKNMTVIGTQKVDIDEILGEKDLLIF